MLRLTHDLKVIGSNPIRATTAHSTEDGAMLACASQPMDFATSSYHQWQAALTGAIAPSITANLNDASDVPIDPASPRT